jgi:hypothetical protein
VDPILQQKIMRRAQRHAPRPEPEQVPLHWRACFAAMAERVGNISDVIACTYKAEDRPVPAWLRDGAPPASAPDEDYGPPAGHPEAESLPLGAQDDVMLAGWSLDLWPQDEYQRITAEGER